MPFQGLQLPQSPKIDSNFDFYTPLAQIGAGLSEQNRLKTEADDAYQQILRMPGLPGQAPAAQAPQEGYLTQLGRKLGLIDPAAAPAAVAQTRSAAVPRLDNQTDLAANRGPNVQSWYAFATRPADQGGLGLTHDQAIGKLANLQAESGSNISTTATGDNGTAYGAAQWRLDRLRNLVKFATDRGLNYKDTATQQAFMRHEYLGSPQDGPGGGSERSAYDALTATRTPQDAATAVNKYYERSADAPGRREAGATRLASSFAPQPATNAALPPEVAGGRSVAPAVPMPVARPAQADQSAAFTATPRVPPQLTPLPPAAQPQIVEPGVTPADQFNALDAQANAPTDVSARSVTPPAPPAASDPQAQVVNALTSPQSVQETGISREQIAALYRNPLTRPLGQALLQKALDPGTYTFQQVGDKLVRTNSRTGRSEVVMSDTKPIIVGEHALVADPKSPSGYRDIAPPSQKPIAVKEDERMIVADPNAPGGYRDITPGGGTGGKIKREIDQRTQEALAKGYPKETADYYGLNGKLPKEDLSATEMKAVTDAQKQVLSGQDVLDNIARLRELSPKAWSGWGATKRASIANALLPNNFVPQGAIDTKELSNLALQNVAGQAKAVFGSRLAVAEVKLLNEIETSPEMSDPERQAIYTRIERIIQRHTKAANDEAEGIRNKTYFKPGGGKGGEVVPLSAASTSRPSLGSIFGQ
jgi:Phage tail lysozyme